MKIILLGPPASGKGTLAEHLVREYQLQHFSSGQLLRKEVEKGTPSGKKATKLFKAGRLIPDELILKLMRPILKQDNYILDGFPRTLAQAKALDGTRFDLILLLDIPDKAVMERVTGRRTCAQGEHIYHLKSNPPKKKGVCDVDGSKLLKRVGDTVAITTARLKVYRELTAPVIEYYQQRGLLRIVNGNQSFEKVYKDVWKLL